VKRFLVAIVAAGALAVALRSSRHLDAQAFNSPTFTVAQATMGKDAYAQHCSSCHGTTFEGGEMAPPLAGGTFNANWNGLSLGDLAERIRISMPQNNPNSLSRQQYVDILAAMLGGGEFPQGNAELPREVDVLRQITFESMKRP